MCRPAVPSERSRFCQRFIDAGFVAMAAAASPDRRSEIEFVVGKNVVARAARDYGPVSTNTSPATRSSSGR